MNHDVLVISVAIEGAYPSAKSQTAGAARYGKKSPAYHDLFTAIYDKGKEALALGWTPIEYPCRVAVDRFSPDHRLRDAINLGQCEFDALTRAGVWTDDSLAKVVALSCHHGAAGHDRVVVTITRLPPPVGAKPRAALPVQPKRRRGPKKERPGPASVEIVVPPDPNKSVRVAYNGKDIPAGMALLGDQLIPRDQALELIRGAQK